MDPAALFATSQRRRNAQAAGLAVGLGTAAAANRARRVFASAARKEALDAELELRTEEQVAATLGQMKGAMMKVAQLASFVDDGMPEPVRQALAQLQQDAPPMSPELAAGVVEAELGARPEEVFAEWDPIPIAAASIGQVHRAITADGQAVAVKVQYPGIDEAVRADLANLDLARLAMPLFWRSLDAEAVAAELRARLSEELDYEIEAANQRSFATWYRAHPFIHVPEVVDELSTRRVLTSELAEGARFAEMERWDQRERNLAAEVIFRFVFRSLYRFHAFNGDPHPGNYVFRRGGRVTFLDFGLVRRFSADEVGRLLAPVRARLLTPDIHSVRLAQEEAGWLVPGAPVPDADVVAYADLFWGPFLEDAPYTVTAESATAFTRQFLFDRDTFGEVLRWTTVPPAYVILQRINLGLVAILGRLNAAANFRRIAEEIWPITDRPPSTELGEKEAAWWTETGAALAISHPAPHADTEA
jgi:predicted unusual protein kinase regulating ubiquinone biosynthesis (AarF/ABC1/UbiB family)